MTKASNHIDDVQGKLFCMMKKSYTKFLEFNTTNPKVYTLFEKYSFQLLNNGGKKLAAYKVMERVKWELSLDEKMKGLFINNSYTCFYSRMFVKRNPGLAHVFGFRGSDQLSKKVL